MAELEIDQSNLPRVQEVCQCFAVLEDGALAHSLQEQEIEQYYTSNIQKNQLVQRDIRIARRLQDEERNNMQHISRQREEEDSEYARLVQEELRRGAEETRRREQEDQEIAKRIQEEEELHARRQTSCHLNANRGKASRPKGPPLAMGDLQQVLLDEELARRLQKEEQERPVRRSPRQSSSPRNGCIDGDFRVAQVAQDEEIARFMQKQEMRAKHGWTDEEEAQRPDTKDPLAANSGDWRASRQRQRERLDSQGLPSPPEAEDCPTEDNLPSTVDVAELQQRGMHNIAEELDPTYQAKTKETLRVSMSTQGVNEHLSQAQSSYYGVQEEPTFVQPTKRPQEKPGRAKAKDKKEGVKHKENCKQQ